MSPTRFTLRRRAARGALALTAVLAFVAAPAGVARADWSTPVTVSPPHLVAGVLQLASGPTGDLLTWQYSEPTAKGPFTTRESYAVARPGGAFGAQRQLPKSYDSGPLVNLGGGRLAQLILAPTGVNTNRIEIALGSVDGSFGAPQAIHGASVFAARASLAGNARGELLLAWIAADTHGEHRVVWASVRAANGRFGPPQIISASAHAEQVSTAIGAQGDAVVAFPNKFGRMLARVRRHGRPWGPLQNIGPAAGGTENDVTPFVGRDGRVVVAWYETQLCSGGCEYPGFTRVAVQPPRASHFGGAQQLERDAVGLFGAPIGVSLAPIVIATGVQAPMIVFLARGATPPAGSPYAPAVVKVSYASAGGYRYASPQTVSPVGEVAQDIAAAAAPHGVLVTWIRAEAPGYYSGTVFAALAPGSGGPFGAPEQASPSESVLNALPTFNVTSDWPRNSIPPWTLVWANRPAGEASPSTIVRVSSPLCPLEAGPPAPPSGVAADPACHV